MNLQFLATFNPAIYVATRHSDFYESVQAQNRKKLIVVYSLCYNEISALNQKMNGLWFLATSSPAIRCSPH